MLGSQVVTMLAPPSGHECAAHGCDHQKKDQQVSDREASFHALAIAEIAQSRSYLC
jgi:hypothetical protein